ncbi:hypothetical protein BCR43DRAFT_477997 [Syncephalastrum racemosum]|uniref:C2H2-type domain-containing protein n=1 Tax=Syncephalastrum racemosum TaxID=13706 RepID=A0A1X2H3U1_SYNRA|nr:hypothetical protein BCR43DRAFT_477997 [Syncephalastrum racemosum]
MEDVLHCRWQGCTQTFFDPEIMYSHLTNDHVGRKSTGNLCLTCHWENCDVTVVKRDHITSHLRVHVPLKPHLCQFCNKTFKRPQDLKKHEKIHSEEHITSLRGHHRTSQQNYSQPLTPPRLNPADSPASSTDLFHRHASPTPPRAPVSPPQSTYSEDSWMHSNHSSNLSPITDACDQFAAPPDLKQVQGDFGNTQQLISGLIFPDDMNAGYNADVANRLNMLENMVSTGAISPQDLSLGINNEQQLADINAWLARLSGSIPPSGFEDPKPDMMYNSQPNYMPAPAAAVDPSMTGNSPYTDVMLQSYGNEAAQLGYPAMPEQDLYVRSQPMMNHGYNSQPNMYANVQPDFGAINNTMAQYDYGMQPVPQQIQQQTEQQYMQPMDMGTTGLRHHYTPVPDVASGYFQPELRTAMNYTSSNSKGQRRSAAYPSEGAQTATQTAESVTPTKASATTHESKKEMATLANVFASSSSTADGSQKLKTNDKSTTEDNSSGGSSSSCSRSTDADDENSKQQDKPSKERPASKSLTKDVMDLLVSDLSDLTLQQQKQQDACKASTQSLYPDSAATTQNKQPKKKADTTATTTTATTTNNASSAPSSANVSERHRQLLQQLGKWVNESYARNQQGQKYTSATSPSSVPVQ